MCSPWGSRLQEGRGLHGVLGGWLWDGTFALAAASGCGAKSPKASFSLVDVKCKAVTSRVPTFALPRQAALGERILSSRPELSAQLPYGFFFSWKQTGRTKVQGTLIPSLHPDKWDTCNKLWWGETCSGACNKPWEGRRWGKGDVELAAKFPSTVALIHSSHG